MVENWRVGRHKHMWVTIGSDLRIDTRRDLDDAGAQHIPVHPLNKLPYGTLASKKVRSSLHTCVPLDNQAPTPSTSCPRQPLPLSRCSPILICLGCGVLSMSNPSQQAVLYRPCLPDYARCFSQACHVLHCPTPKLLCEYPASRNAS